MSRFYSYLNTSKNIIENYAGEMPLAHHLRKFFKTSNKYGSKDRREISELVYNYYRVSNVLIVNDLEEKILMSTYLCNENKSIVTEHLKVDWADSIHQSINDKLIFLGINFDFKSIFPFPDQTSKSLDQSVFGLSFLTQPKLFVRIRPGFKNRIISQLIAESTDYELIEPDCLAFENGTKIDQILKVGQEVIIQDYSSQIVGDILDKYLLSDNARPTVWDCCAASGGKSIRMYDSNNQIELTVSDVRESILENLKERFHLAGIKHYKSLLADLTNKNSAIDEKFDLILADVPCSGSGTWARTPEEKHFFKKEKIQEYASLQYQIVSNVIANLKTGGYLIYITCSVFELENEAQVEKILENYPLVLIEQKLLVGIEHQADSMFIAVLRKQ
ncbi:MAG: RsmB/NOP family class I SAM-dependent RNA methyltransferase [Bacteroidota bacterium]